MENAQIIGIAIRLIKERERLGYSQRAFARELGITTNGLANYENGKSCISAKCLAAAALLGADVQYILIDRSSNRRDEAVHDEGKIVNIQNGARGNFTSGVSGGTVNQVYTEKYSPVTKVETKPGATHITEEQCAIITKLVKDIVELEEKLKKDPKTFRGVWSSLNAHMKVASYRLIPFDGFPKAEKYLRMWIGRLNSMPSAPQKDEDAWRKRTLAYIAINSRDDEEAIQRYTQKKFQTTGLRELSNDELKLVRNYVSGRKRRITKD